MLEAAKIAAAILVFALLAPPPEEPARW